MPCNELHELTITTDIKLRGVFFLQRPRAFDGFTQIVANNRGHLLSGVKRSRESPWGNFVGTWDMPLNIPGTCL